MKKLHICAVHSNYLTKDKVFDSGNSLHFGLMTKLFGKNYVALRHSLYSGGESRIYCRGISGRYSLVPYVGDLPDPLRYVCEILINFGFLMGNFRKKVVYYGVDPLSAFPACLAKVLGLDVKVIFLSPD